MFNLKRIVENLSERVVNEDIYVKNSKVYIKDLYLYSEGNWYIKVDNNWINLQGGIPGYEVETNLDPDIFEENI